MIIHSWDFKDILKHLIGIEFPIMSLTRSTCCTRHRAWKSARRAETQAHTGSPAGAFVGESLGQQYSPFLPLIGSKVKFSGSMQRDGWGIIHSQSIKKETLCIDHFLWDYILNNKKKHISPKVGKLTSAKLLHSNSAPVRCTLLQILDQISHI